MTTPPTGPSSPPPWPPSSPTPPPGWPAPGPSGLPPNLPAGGPPHPPSQPPGGYGYGYGGAPVQAEVCAFHPDRPTGLHCTRCGRPACPECLTPASVGFHCRACVAEARAAVRPARTVAGSRLDQQPLVTGILIGLNVIAFVITAVQSRSVLNPDNSSWFQQGAMSPELVAAGQYWRLVTSGFLHLSLIHIAVNMLSLYVLGNPLERILGRLRYLTVYLLALIGGSVSVLLFAGTFSLAAGASGAIFGLMGAMFVTFRRLRLDPRQLIGIVVLNLVLSFSIPGISWQAHVGGLLVGAIAGAIMVYAPQERRKAWQWGGSVGLLVLMLAVTLVWSATHTPEFCSVVNGYYVPCSS